MISIGSAYDPQNPFAKILRGELPSLKLLEDAHTLAIMDIMPQADGHVLVIPKEPAVTLLELSEAATLACVRVAHRLMAPVQRAMNADGVMLMQVNGSAAGQTVPHVHFHVIPRYDGEPLRLHAAKMEERSKLESFAAKISAELQQAR